MSSGELMMSYRLLVLCLCLSFAFSACAQSVAAPASDFASGTEQRLLPTDEHMVVSVDVVEVYFNVRAGSQFVPGLPKEEFEVLENGRPEVVRYFSALSEQPLRIGLMIDTSGSQTRVIQAEKEVAGNFLDQVLRDGDQAMLVSFDSGVELKQDFTSSTEKLHEALRRVERASSHSSPELGDMPAPRRSTALYDSIRLVSSSRMRRVQARKVFIILTDGEDQGSRTTADDAITAALQSDAICYVLLVADSEVSSRKGYQGETKMEELAKSTGGRLIHVRKHLRDLQKRFDEISLELRNHYSIGYTPQDRSSRVEYRRLSVQSKHGFRVQARQGYFANFKKQAEGKR